MTDWWSNDKVVPMDQGDPYNVLPNTAPKVAGDDYLKLLPPEMRNIVKNLAHYKVNPGSLSIMGGHRERMLGAALRYDPEYDQAAYNARAAAIKEFNAGGPTSPAGQITAGNTAMQHLKELLEAAEDLKNRPELLQGLANKDIRVISPLAARLQNATIEGTSKGEPLARFRNAANHYSEEVTKFYSGSAGSEAEKTRALRTLDPSLSVQELRAALREEAKLMSGKVNALQDRFKNALGPKAWLTAIEGLPQFPVLQKKTEEALNQIYERTAPPAPAQTKAPPSPQPDPEGWITLPGGTRMREVKPAAPPQQ